MENHIVNSYDKELDKLRHSVICMANLVKDLMNVATSAIKNQNQSFIEIANSTDKKINYFDEEIENLAIQVIALRQPMAIDLRQIIAALKLAVILERMGDLSKKISHRIEYLPVKLNDNMVALILEMIIKLEGLLTEVICAYETLDVKLAHKISKQDHAIDLYYQKIMELLEKEMETKPKETKYLLNIVLVMRNLERIGDYITKISYIINYIITGNKIISD